MTKLSQLKIDPEFQNQINPPSFEETHQLEMNILKEKRVLNPIITWNGYSINTVALRLSRKSLVSSIHGKSCRTPCNSAFTELSSRYLKYI